jgi:hypothetical protein
VVEKRDILTLVAWNTRRVMLTVVEVKLPLEAETSSTIKTGKEPDDREISVVISVGLVGLVHECSLSLRKLQVVVVN